MLRVKIGRTRDHKNEPVYQLCVYAGSCADEDDERGLLRTWQIDHGCEHAEVARVFSVCLDTLGEKLTGIELVQFKEDTADMRSKFEAYLGRMTQEDLH